MTFIDPSLVDDTWADPQSVNERFYQFGVTNVTHHRMTTQQFVETETYRDLDEVGIVMIDGMHTEEQAKFDFEAFVDKVPSHGVLLLHDSISLRTTHIYGEENAYDYTVRFFVDQLKRDAAFQVMDFPFQHGLTIVRRHESMSDD